MFNNENNKNTAKNIENDVIKATFDMMCEMIDSSIINAKISNHYNALCEMIDSSIVSMRQKGRYEDLCKMIDSSIVNMEQKCEYEVLCMKIEKCISEKKRRFTMEDFNKMRESMNTVRKLTFTKDNFDNMRKNMRDEMGIEDKVIDDKVIDDKVTDDKVIDDKVTDDKVIDEEMNGMMKMMKDLDDENDRLYNKYANLVTNIDELREIERDATDDYLRRFNEICDMIETTKKQLKPKKQVRFELPEEDDDDDDYEEDEDDDDDDYEEDDYEDEDDDDDDYEEDEDFYERLKNEYAENRKDEVVEWRVETVKRDMESIRKMYGYDLEMYNRKLKGILELKERCEEEMKYWNIMIDAKMKIINTEISIEEEKLVLFDGKETIKILNKKNGERFKILDNGEYLKIILKG
jgi:hypothetical protein